MRKLIKSLVIAYAFWAFAVLPAYSQEYGVSHKRVYFHITTNTTQIVVAGTAATRVESVWYWVSGTPTTWVITLRDHLGTPAILNAESFSAASTKPSILAPPVAPQCSGLEINTAGTAGVLDIWIDYR